MGGGSCVSVGGMGVGGGSPVEAAGAAQPTIPHAIRATANALVCMICVPSLASVPLIMRIGLGGFKWGEGSSQPDDPVLR